MTIPPKRQSTIRRIVLLGVVAFVLLTFHRPILAGAGRYFAPTATGEADVLVLEGNNAIDRAFLHAGMALLPQGRANHIVVILFYSRLSGLDSGVESKSSRFIALESHSLGVKKEQVSVIWVPISGHPITLSEAKFVTDRLYRDGVRSAILFCDGFHTRRSIAAYRREASRLGLNIIPFASFTSYPRDSWWRTSAGIDDFVEQSLKFAFYLIRGYLPITSLWSL